MIYTVTLSPSLDYIVEVDNFKIGAINRSKNERFYPGGKGINVSIALANLGAKTKALGFAGGFVGDFILNKLNEFNVECDFIRVDGVSRINVKIPGDCETAINGSGPTILSDDINLLISKLKELKNGDVLVISGAVPKSINQNIYEEILKNVNKNVRVIVDTTKNFLIDSLKYKPFLIKPNKEELEEALDIKIENDDMLILATKKLIDMGAENVIVSLGSDGAILMNKNCYFRVNAIKGKAINTVGAGDFVIAGFIYDYLKSNDLASALKFGVCCGSARAFYYLPTKEEILNIYNKM